MIYIYYIHTHLHTHIHTHIHTYLCGGAVHIRILLLQYFYNTVCGLACFGNTQSCNLKSVIAKALTWQCGESLLSLCDGWLVAWGLCGCVLIGFSPVWLLPFTLL